MIKKILLLNLSSLTFTSMQMQQPTPIFMNNPIEIVTTTKGWNWFLENIYNPFIQSCILIVLFFIAMVLISKEK